MERDVKFYSDEDEGTPEGPVRISAYLPVDDELEEKRARLEQSLWHLGQIQPLPEPKFKFIEDEDWMAAWKKNYQPIEVGRGLLILPAWIEQTDMTRTAIKIDPAMAFGTGTHPTTQLCLALMEDRVKAGEAVIDVGCGSGILSIGALKLGAWHALAVDIDPLSTRATLSNAILNDVDDNMEVALGFGGGDPKGALFDPAGAAGAGQHPRPGDHPAIRCRAGGAGFPGRGDHSIGHPGGPGSGGAGEG